MVPMPEVTWPVFSLRSSWVFFIKSSGSGVVKIVVTWRLKCLEVMSFNSTETKRICNCLRWFWFLNVFVHNCVFRIPAQVYVEQVSEVFQVPAMRTWSLVLFSRLTDYISFLSRPSVSGPWLFVVGRRWGREKEPEHIAVMRFGLIWDLTLFSPPFPSGVWIIEAWWSMYLTASAVHKNWHSSGGIIIVSVE